MCQSYLTLSFIPLQKTERDTAGVKNTQQDKTNGLIQGLHKTLLLDNIGAFNGRASQIKTQIASVYIYCSVVADVHVSASPVRAQVAMGKHRHSRFGKELYAGCPKRHNQNECRNHWI